MIEMAESEPTSAAKRLDKIEGWISWALTPHGVATIYAFVMSTLAAIGALRAEFTKGPPPPDKPNVSPIQPPIKLPELKVVLYLSARLTSLDSVKAALPGVSVTVDSVVHPAGSTYPWQGQAIPLPCAALIGPDGTVRDVRPYTTAAELAAWVKEQK